MSLHPAWKALRPDEIISQVSAAVAAAPLREPAFVVIDALQRFKPAIQVQAAFVAAAIMARALGKDAHELLAMANRQLPEVEAVESAASAISDYAKGELK